MPRVYVTTAANVDSVEFNGNVYRRYPDSPRPHLRKYYSRSRSFLHRVIWEDAYGEIPEGHHIHHKDGNHLNNDLDNLQCLPVAEHHREHSDEYSKRGRSDAQIKHLASIRTKAAAWHKSDEGLAWHALHGKRSWLNRVKIGLVCQECGTAFESFFSDAKFCGKPCQNKAWYKAHPGYEEAKRARRKASRLQSHGG